MLRYKFIELSTVTDEDLEEAVNAWVAKGWRLDDIRFVVTEHSRRPAMAYISFTREVADGSAEADSSDEADEVGEGRLI